MTRAKKLRSPIPMWLSDFRSVGASSCFRVVKPRLMKIVAVIKRAPELHI